MPVCHIIYTLQLHTYISTHTHAHAGAAGAKSADETAQVPRVSKELDGQTDNAYALQQALSRERSKSALLDEQIKELTPHIARLNAEVTAELVKEEALVKLLAEEKDKVDILKSTLCGVLIEYIYPSADFRECRGGGACEAAG